MEEESPYINSGVTLMNIYLLRKEQCYKDVFDFIENKKTVLLLPDQAIISSLYGSQGVYEKLL
jgi:lipopolysaccharide biosynthesis glycosyltransferase